VSMLVRSAVSRHQRLGAASGLSRTATETSIGQYAGHDGSFEGAIGQGPKRQESKLTRHWGMGDRDPLGGDGRPFKGRFVDWRKVCDDTENQNAK